MWMMRAAPKLLAALEACEKELREQIEWYNQQGIGVCDEFVKIHQTAFVALADARGEIPF
jgi:hypothetical protein